MAGADGTVRWLQWSDRAFFGSDGRVETATAGLRAANRELEAFSRHVSHDLRAPLRAIDGYLGIMMARFGPELPPDAVVSAGRAREGVLRANRFLEGLLSLSRLSSRPLQVERVEPAAIVRGVLDELLPDRGERRVEVEVAPLPSCLADPEMLRHVYQNLLSSALKFTRTRDPARIGIGASTEEREVVFFVPDNGVGFPPEVAARVYDDFARFHDPETYEGSGLGLPLVRRIVERHGGRCWAESTVDRGATFSFALPSERPRGPARHGCEPFSLGKEIVSQRLLAAQLMTAPPPFMAAIRQPAFLYSSDGRVASANESAEALAGRPLAGCSVADVIGIFDARTPGGTRLVPGAFLTSRALAGEATVDVPLGVTAADGRTVHVLASSSPLADDAGGVGALECWQDVSALEAARARAGASAADLAVQREELRQQGAELARAVSGLERERRLLDAILERTPHTVSLWSGDGRVVWMSDATAAALGRPVADLVGRTWEELGLDPGAMRPFMEDVRGVIASGEPVANELEYSTDDGPVWREYSIVPFPFADGSAVGALVASHDATARKRAVHALERNEEEHRHLVEHAPAGVFEIDYSGPRLRRVNDAVCRVVGYTREELLAMDPGDLLDDEGRARLRERARTALAGDPIDPSASYRLFARDRREIRAELHLKPAFTDGRMEGALVVAHDVTGQDARTAGILESLQDGVCSLDPDWRFSYVNRQAAEALGVAPEKLLGRSLWEACPLVLGTEIEAAIRRVMQGRDPVRFEHTGVLDGAWYSIGVYPAAGGGISVLWLDQTERRRAEAAREDLLRALQQECDTLKAVVRSIADEVWFVDAPDRPIALMNPAAVAGLGFEGEEATPFDELLASLEILDADETPRPPEEAPIYRSLAGEVVSGEEQVRHRRTGELRYRRYHAAPVRADSGEVLGAVSVVSDVTGERRASEELLEFAEKLRRSNEELERFAYVASHDLQEPLRPIVSFSQLLQRRYAGQLDDEADDYLAFIVEGGERLQTLIRDLLQFSRLEATASPPAPTDAGRVVENVVRRFVAPIRTAGATIEVGHLPVVLVDPTQLDLAVANLLANAIKYRRPKVPLTVRVSAERRGRMVEFAVADNGIGIEAEYFDRIFVIFQRLHTRDRYEGTGIGLAIVKKVVERHGGTVRVESTPGKGSIFFFTLPAG